MLSTAEIGTYEMLFYIGTTLSFFWIAGLLQGTLPIHPRLGELDKKRFFYNAYLIHTGLSVVLFLLLYYGRSWIVPIMVGQEELPFYNLFCFYLLINLPTYLVEYIYLLNDRPVQIVRFGVLAFGGQVLVIIVPLFLGFGLLWSFRLLLLLAVIKHLWLWSNLLHYAQADYNSELLWEYLSLSLPLIAYAFMAGFATLLDQWLVAWKYDGDQEVFAIFRYGARELPLATALAAAFSASMIPELAKNKELGIDQLKHKSVKLFHILFPVGILALLISQWAFPLVFNPDFAESAQVFNVYLLAIASRLMFPQTILIAQKETGILLKVSILEILLNILLSFIFIQKWGLLGVAYATVIAFLFEKCFLVIYLFKKFGIPFGRYTDLKWFLSYAALLGLIFLLV